MEIKEGVLSLKGATCASCAYTIEHVGRKVKGIEDIRVDSGQGKIFVKYEEDPYVLEKIRSIVRSIGYDANIL